MCSSTLKFGEDYAEVLSDAKQTATEVAKTVSDFFDITSSFKEMKVKVFEIDVTDQSKIEFEISMAGIEGSLKQQMYSFSGGMKLAIDAYFKSIAP